MTKDKLLQRNRESDTDVTIPLRRISTGDMRTLRNVNIAACEIQTGDTGTAPNRGSSNARLFDMIRWRFHFIFIYNNPRSCETIQDAKTA